MRLAPPALALVMGTSRRDTTLVRLRYCVHTGLVRASYDGHMTTVTVPNWPKIQGTTPRKPREESRVEESREEKKNICAVSSTQRVLEVWNLARKAFSEYGRNLRERPSMSRSRTISARLRESPTQGADLLIQAIHGYVEMHGLVPTRDFDPRKHFSPETIWRPSKIEKYADACRAAIAAGRHPPYESVPRGTSLPLSAPAQRDQRTREVAEKLKREHF
jgi:hypothetical protein